MTKLSNPVPIYLDTRGGLLDGGYIYVGEAYTDPQIEANQLALFWDAALTIPAAQPLRTLGGFIVNGGNTGFVFMAEDDYSLTVLDQNEVLVPGGSVPSIQEAAGVDYQPLDADLTTISGQANTSFGLALLTLANTAALKSATGIPDCLPLTGGTVSGAIVRSGSGIHAFFADALMTGGRIYGPHASGTADATSQPGDMQFFY